jgi:hypothetical protein
MKIGEQAWISFNNSFRSAEFPATAIDVPSDRTVFRLTSQSARISPKLSL